MAEGDTCLENPNQTEKSHDSASLRSDELTETVQVPNSVTAPPNVVAISRSTDPTKVPLLEHRHPLSKGDSSSTEAPQEDVTPSENPSSAQFVWDQLASSIGKDRAEHLKLLCSTKQLGHLNKYVGLSLNIPHTPISGFASGVEELYGAMLLDPPYTAWIAGSKVKYVKKGYHEGILVWVTYRNRGGKYQAYVLTSDEKLVSVDLQHVITLEEFVSDEEFQVGLQKAVALAHQTPHRQTKESTSGKVEKAR